MSETGETQNRTNPEATTASKRDPYTYKPMSSRRRVITLAIGDAIVFLVFASIGQNSHGEPLSIPSIIFIALPFTLGWFLVAPFAGAFREDIASNPRRMANRTIQAWFPSWPVAMALRWLLVDRTRNTSLISFITFAFVALVIIVVLLLLWRWPFAFNNSIREREKKR
jgi:Protein of unknown function (DUF3054)